jgi:hypothetical protein
LEILSLRFPPDFNRESADAVHEMWQTDFEDLGFSRELPSLKS